MPSTVGQMYRNKNMNNLLPLIHVCLGLNCVKIVAFNVNANVVCICRIVCESLLLSDRLKWELSEKWCMTFQLMRRIIGGVDYKVSHNVII